MGVVEIESQWTARKREWAGVFPTVKVRSRAENPAQAKLERGTLSIGNGVGWAPSSYRHYANGEVGVVEIESQWTARKREWAGVFPTVKVRSRAENPRPSKA